MGTGPEAQMRCPALGRRRAPQFTPPMEVGAVGPEPVGLGEGPFVAMGRGHGEAHDRAGRDGDVVAGDGLGGEATDVDERRVQPHHLAERPVEVLGVLACSVVLARMREQATGTPETPGERPARVAAVRGRSTTRPSSRDTSQRSGAGRRTVGPLDGASGARARPATDHGRSPRRAGGWNRGEPGPLRRSTGSACPSRRCRSIGRRFRRPSVRHRGGTSGSAS